MLVQIPESNDVDIAQEAYIIFRTKAVAERWLIGAQQHDEHGKQPAWHHTWLLQAYHIHILTRQYLDQNKT